MVPKDVHQDDVQVIGESRKFKTVEVGLFWDASVDVGVMLFPLWKSP